MPPLKALLPLALAVCGPLCLFRGTDALAQGTPQRVPHSAGPVIERDHPPPAAASWPKACSVRNPICVHAPAGMPSAVWLAALESADRAWEAVTDALDLPPPDGGPDGAWHVYMVDEVDGGGRALPEGRDPRARFDSAYSFALVDRSTRPGCSLDRALARVVLRGSLWRVAPAIDDGSAIAQVEGMAKLTTLCADGEDAAAFQLHPERALIDPASPSFDRGASMFFGWLDATFAASPGVFVEGLWALSPTRTSPEAWRWAGAPTTFDVLRASVRDLLWQGSTFDDVLVRFAIERASADPPPRFAWNVPWPVVARRLAASDPVDPTGASFVKVDLAGAPSGAKLHVEVEWEDYGRMRWIVAKIDPKGQVRAQIPVGSLGRSPKGAVTVENLEGFDHLLVAGVNVGSTEQAFDPDQGEWEPHGWLLTIGAN